MKLKNILIVVDDIEESIRFYNELFGLNVISSHCGPGTLGVLFISK